MAVVVVFGGGGLACRMACAASFDLPQENAVPGGVKILRLDAQGSVPPEVQADGRRVLVVQDDSTWVAVIGIPLSAPLGEARVTVKTALGRKELTFDVGYKQYASESLKVPPRQANLSRADLARLAGERVRIEHALTSFSQPPPESLHLPQPVPGPRSSSFGMRRIFNGESRNPHS